MMNFLNRLDGILDTAYGWVIGSIVCIANFFAGYGICFIGVIVCIALDAVFGIWAAIKQGKYAKSELMRDTITKVFSYGGAMVVIVFVEKIIGMGNPILAAAVSACICLVELWSLSANALIVNPKLLFFKLLQPALRGEIARKLNITEDEVEEALKTKATNKKNAKSN